MIRARFVPEKIGKRQRFGGLDEVDDPDDDKEYAGECGDDDEGTLTHGALQG